MKYCIARCLGEKECVVHNAGTRGSAHRCWAMSGADCTVEFQQSDAPMGRKFAGVPHCVYLANAIFLYFLRMGCFSTTSGVYLSFGGYF